VRALSFDGWNQILLQGSWRDVWVLDTRLTVRESFPFAPDASPTELLANRLVGASRSSGEHLLAWDMESPVRSVGWAVRVRARMVGPRRPLGEPCLGDFECGSGECAEGICCDDECDGECE